MTTTPSQNNNQLAGSADRIPKANGHPDPKPSRSDVIRHFAEETVKAKEHLVEIARRVMRAKPARLDVIRRMLTAALDRNARRRSLNKSGWSESRIEFECPRCGLQACYVFAGPDGHDRIEILDRFESECRTSPQPDWADRCRAFMLAKNRVERSHPGKHRAPTAE